MIPSIRNSSAVVVDASLLVDAVLELGRFAERIAGIELHAPVTIDAEIIQALRRRWMIGHLPDVVADGALLMFERFEIIRYPVEPLKWRMWSLRRNITAYDAGYVALAESLALPLITRDARLSRSTGHAARIEYIA